MKKIILLFTFLTIFSFSLAAQSTNTVSSPEKTDSKWSSISYVNVPILKIMEGKDGYVIIYQKNKTGIGNVVIPKKWAKGDTKNPRKLKFRKVTNNVNSFMTVVKKDGEFLRVILSVPMSKQVSIWGLADTRQGLEGADKDTLEDLEF